MTGLIYETGGPSGPASATGRFTWRAAYRVQVKWEWTTGGFTLDQSRLNGPDVLGPETTDGYITLGVSRLNGPDVLAPSPLYIPNFVGAYDNLNDPHDSTWPRRLDQLGWSRGMDGDLASVQSGKATVVVVDKKGLLNPKNAASPIRSLTAKPLRPIRIQTHLPWEADGLWRTCFFGYTRSLDYDPAEKTCTIQAEDLMLRLQRTIPTIVPLQNTSTGEAIGHVLDSFGWSDPALRSIDTGDPIETFEPPSDQDALAAIGSLLATEFGIFWVTGEGKTRFESRQARPLKTVARTLTNEMHALGPGSDLDRVINRATFTPADGDAQEYTDAFSADPIRGYGLNPANPVTSLYITTGRQAMRRSQYLVQLRKDPVGPVWKLSIDSRTQEQLEAMAFTEINDLLEVSEAQTGTTGRFFVERIERELAWPQEGTPTDAATYILTERTHDPFRLDLSVLNGQALLEL